jgi:hypothetical protein
VVIGRSAAARRPLPPEPCTNRPPSGGGRRACRASSEPCVWHHPPQTAPTARSHPPAASELSPVPGLSASAGLSLRRWRFLRPSPKLMVRLGFLASCCCSSSCEEAGARRRAGASVAVASASGAGPGWRQAAVGRFAAAAGRQGRPRLGLRLGLRIRGGLLPPARRAPPRARPLRAVAGPAMRRACPAAAAGAAGAGAGPEAAAWAAVGAAATPASRAGT